MKTSFQNYPPVTGMNYWTITEHSRKFCWYFDINNPCFCVRQLFCLVLRLFICTGWFRSWDNFMFLLCEWRLVTLKPSGWVWRTTCTCSVYTVKGFRATPSVLPWPPVWIWVLQLRDLAWSFTQPRASPEAYLNDPALQSLFSFNSTELVVVSVFYCLLLSWIRSCSVAQVFSEWSSVGLNSNSIPLYFKTTKTLMLKTSLQEILQGLGKSFHCGEKLFNL